MKEKVRRKPKRLLAMNARNRVILEVNVPSSNSRTKEQRKGIRPSKLHGISPPNRKGRKEKGESIKGFTKRK